MNTTIESMQEFIVKNNVAYAGWLLYRTTACSMWTYYHYLTPVGSITISAKDGMVMNVLPRITSSKCCGSRPPYP
jgi:hypothetical protein